MSVVSQVILQADDELRYPTSGELKGIREFFLTGEQRTRIAEILSSNEKKIVEEASKSCGKNAPTLSLRGATPTATVSAPSVCVTMAGISAW